MNRLIIIGASGHGKVVADIALLNGYHSIHFLDDDESIKECGGFPVVGKSSDALLMDGDKIVAIGNSEIRQRIQAELDPVTLIHPNAVIGRNVQIGKGTVIMAGVIINPDTKIGNGCIINTGSSVDHDCELGDYVHISVGAHICGGVSIGEKTWIGAGAIVNNYHSICGGCMIGSGSVVVKDIIDAGTYIGVPAMKKGELTRKHAVLGLGGG